MLKNHTVLHVEVDYMRYEADVERTQIYVTRWMEGVHVSLK